MRWDERFTQKPLMITNEGRTLSWGRGGDGYQIAWLGAQADARPSGGRFGWEFRIEAIAGRQIGVGLLLDPSDWGFFGYLGAGRRAWAYDAYEGAIVTETRAIHSGLPTIRESGTVAVRLDLATRCEFEFVVDGVNTPAIALPRDAVAIPAACLLKPGQVVTLANFQRIE